MRTRCKIIDVSHNLSPEFLSAGIYLNCGNFTRMNLNMIILITVIVKVNMNLIAEMITRNTGLIWCKAIPKQTASTRINLHLKL